MCTKNDSPEKLKELRSKGHVLRKGYKVMDHRYNDWYSTFYSYYKWSLGWNQAHRTDNFCGRRRKGTNLTRTQPYVKKNHVVEAGFHVCLTRDGAKEWATDISRIVPVWFYCDEVTAYQGSMFVIKGHVITVSRVLVTKFPS